MKITIEEFYSANKGSQQKMNDQFSIKIAEIKKTIDEFQSANKGSQEILNIIQDQITDLY